MATTFSNQLGALLRRNYLLVLRQLGMLILELLFPVILLIYIPPQIRLQQEKSYHPISPDINSEVIVCFYPDIPNVRNVAELATTIHQQDVAPARISKNFSNSEIGITTQLQNSECDVAVLFLQDVRLNGTYELRMIQEKKGLAFDYSCSEICEKDSLLPAFQRAMDTALIKFWSKNTDLDLRKPLMSLVPVSENNKKELTMAEKQSVMAIPIYLAIGFSFLMGAVCTIIVQEKERKIKETMTIMGLNASAYWIAWFLTRATILFITVVLQMITISVQDIFQSTNLFIVFVMLFLFGCSIITLAFMMTPFFKSSKTAGLVSSMAVLVLSLFHLVAIFIPEATSKIMYFLASLLSPSAFTLGIQKICELDLRGGFHFNNLFEGKFSVADSIFMLLVDILLYSVLTYEFDNMLSEESGRCIRGSPIFQSLLRLFSKSSGYSNAENEELPSQNEDVEPMPQEFIGKESIRIRNVKKFFNTGKKDETRAVDGISMDLYKDQITALLGHNGAGKTTLMKMVTGNLNMCSGEISVDGMNIKNNSDLRRIRSMWGVCPQENILFDQLTPYEHLTFFGRIKGLYKENIQNCVDQILTELDLLESKDAFTMPLSGGEKRKLCIGIAILGQPKILFLDEPSTGLDPTARQKLWSTLRSYKEGRTILLTTHYMDEADILADRKAVISNGKLRCLGTSMFLKMKFGIGYHLRMEISSSCDSSSVLSHIQQHDTNASSTRSSSNEMRVILPSMDTAKLTTLLLDLENFSSDLGVQGYGISLPTLEEVFLKLEDDQEQEDGLEKLQEGSEENIPLQSDVISNSNWFLTQQKPKNVSVCLEFLKIRFLLIKRHPSNIFFILFFPLLYSLLPLLLNNSISAALKVENNDIILNERPYHGKLSVVVNKTGHEIETVIDTLKFYDFNVQILNSMRQKDFTMGVVVQDYNISDETVNISWEWTFNLLPKYARLAVINLMSNTIWNSLNKTNKDIHHLKTSIREISMRALSREILMRLETKITAFTIVLGISAIASIIGVEAVADKKEGAKTQLHISGFTFSMYWTGTFIAHATFYLVAVVCLCVFATAIGMPSFHDNSTAKVIFWIIAFLNISPTLLYVYVLSYPFKSTHTAKTMLFGPIIWVFFVFKLYHTTFFHFDHWLLLVKLVLLFWMISLNVFPASFCTYFIGAIICPFCTLIGASSLLCELPKTLVGTLNVEVLPPMRYYLTWHSGIPLMFIAIFSSSLLYLLLLRIIDGSNYNFFCNPCHPSIEQSELYPSEEDEDVSKEAKDSNYSIINADENTPYVLWIKKLMKIYSPRCCVKKKVAAVKNLSFGVKAGEIFGFLGPNGAGKTSTVKVVTGEERATSGEIFIGNKKITSVTSHGFNDIGYCPQEDPLWERITLEEHLRFYCIVRGIKPQLIKGACKRIMDMLNITSHRNKKASELSGGTKRKLVCILSMLSPSKLLLLDEPCSGIDPKTKRTIWDLIRKNIPPDSPNAAFITTHSMEEAETICTRIAIIVNGALKCVGSVQHLKDKYGDGYVLQIRLPVSMMQDDKVELTTKLQEFVNATFPKAKLTITLGDWLSYSVPKEAVFSLADAFQALEAAKKKFQFLDFSFSQATLEQVFLSLTKEQVEVKVTY